MRLFILTESDFDIPALVIYQKIVDIIIAGNASAQLHFYIVGDHIPPHFQEVYTANESNVTIIKTREAQHLNTTNTIQKRGRKSFASMDAEMGKVNIPSAEILEKKLYYPIGEVAHWFNVNTSLIRYWEKEFKQIQPRKTRKGDRLFRVQDIELLKQIYFLLREKKYSIDGAKTYLKNNKEKAEKNIAVLNSLKNLKSFLMTLKENL